jgi:hypothetical protein
LGYFFSNSAISAFVTGEVPVFCAEIRFVAKIRVTGASLAFDDDDFVLEQPVTMRAAAAATAATAITLLLCIVVLLLT